MPNSVYSVNNIYLEGVRIAAVIPSGDARYYLTDQVDSVKVVADDNGLPVSRMEYMPYGETWFQEGDTNNAPKYNSQELDTESNFYYYNARHYSQEIARFVTADTVIDGEFDTQGWNRYAYCKNNPIEYKDPSGHYSVSELWEDVKETASGAVESVKQVANDAKNYLTEKMSSKTEGKSVTPSSHNDKGIVITSPYPDRLYSRNSHSGIDIRLGRSNSEVARAVESGSVIGVGKDSKGNTFVSILGDKSGYKVDYYHIGGKQNRDKLPDFAVGDKVKKGDVLGLPNKQGTAKAYHLHLKVDKGTYNEEKKIFTSENPVDPVKYLSEYNPRKKYLFDNSQKSKDMENYYKEKNKDAYNEIKYRTIRKE